MEIVIGVDIGGTFTDAVAADIDGGYWHAKVPTTPGDLSQGFGDAVLAVLESAKADPDQVTYVLHGTTVATNTVLQLSGAKTAVITTAGFKHVLHIGRHDVPRGESHYLWNRAARPVSPESVFEVRERVAADGSVLTPLHQPSIRELARILALELYEAVAIVFLHSYANPQHEQQAASVIAEELPDAYVSISSDVLPVFREYERTMATALNSFVGPGVAGYMRSLQAQLRTLGISAPLLIMKSNGGVFSAEAAGRSPIQTILSGPAAGVIGSLHTGNSAGLADLISLDVGGTSADASLIVDGEHEVRSDAKISGLPLSIPTLDIHTIGAGGGSIARITPTGNLTVGPASAGAEPGPAAYGLGGVEPTVTDADLVLGRLPDQLAGGKKLDKSLARTAIARCIAEPLGLTVEEAALAIVEIVDHAMTGAVRRISVERGHDPKRFVLVAAGGAGPVHAGRIGGLLGVKAVLVPPAPGVIAATGLLQSDLRNDYTLTCLERPPDYDLGRLTAAFRSIEDAAQRWLGDQHMPLAATSISRSADVRYPGQGYEISVECPSGTIDNEWLAAVATNFHIRHEQLYGHSNAKLPVEIVNVRVTARGAVQGVGDRKLVSVPEVAGHARPSGKRGVLFDALHGFVECPLYDRLELPIGVRISGPAIVEQRDSTVLIPPEMSGKADAAGNLILTFGGSVHE